MQDRNLEYTEEAVEALDEVTQYLKTVIHHVARRCALDNGRSVITPQCVEVARDRITSALTEPKSDPVVDKEPATPWKEPTEDSWNFQEQLRYGRRVDSETLVGR